MSKELEALKRIRIEAGTPYFSTLYDIDMWREDFKTVETALEIVEYLKQICLDGKDKYGKDTWGWIEFDLDKHPKLKRWLKDDRN